MHPLLLYCFTEPLKPAGLLEQDSKGEERWKETKTERKEKRVGRKNRGRKGEGKREKEKIYRLRQEPTCTSPSVTSVLDWNNPYTFSTQA